MSQIITHIMVAFVILAGVVGAWFQWTHPSQNARIFGWPTRASESVGFGVMFMLIASFVLALAWHTLRLTGVMVVPD